MLVLDTSVMLSTHICTQNHILLHITKGNSSATCTHINREFYLYSHTVVLKTTSIPFIPFNEEILTNNFKINVISFETISLEGLRTFVQKQMFYEVSNKYDPRLALCLPSTIQTRQEIIFMHKSFDTWYFCETNLLIG